MLFWNSKYGRAKGISGSCQIDVIDIMGEKEI